MILKHLKTAVSGLFCLVSITLSAQVNLTASQQNIAELNDSASNDEGDITIPANEYNVPASGVYDNWNNSVLRYQKKEGVLTAADSMLRNGEVCVQLVSPDMGGFYAPLKLLKVNSKFGYRHSRFHTGIDLGLNIGDTVYCAFNGMVRFIDYYKGYGKLIVIRHENGLETYYAHLSKILVDSNQMVHAGDVIGLGGVSGRSTGPHLHFETRYLGNAINPESFIDFEKGTLKNESLQIGRAFATDEMVSPTIPSAQKAKYYSVKKGDTLGHIASKYHTSVKQLCKLNKIKETKVLQIGQKIRVS